MPQQKKRKSLSTADAMAALATGEEDRLRDEILQELEREPKKVRPLHSLCFSEHLLAPQAAMQYKEQDWFHTTLVKIANVPKKTMSSVLMGLNLQQFSVAQLDATNSANKSALMKLFHFVLGTNATFAWPQGDAHHKASFEAACIHVAQGLNRYNHVVFGSQGDLDFSTCGVYKLMPEAGDTKTHLKHVSTNTTVPCVFNCTVG